MTTVNEDNAEYPHIPRKGDDDDQRIAGAQLEEGVYTVRLISDGHANHDDIVAIVSVRRPTGLNPPITFEYWDLVTKPKSSNFAAWSLSSLAGGLIVDHKWSRVVQGWPFPTDVPPFPVAGPGIPTVPAGTGFERWRAIGEKIATT